MPSALKISLSLQGSIIIRFGIILDNIGYHRLLMCLKDNGQLCPRGGEIRDAKDQLVEPDILGGNYEDLDSELDITM